MSTRREVRRNRKAFKEAQRAAARAGGSICGVVHDGVPVYFAVPAGSTDSEISDAAFLAVNGRPRNDAERMLGHMAKKVQA